MRINSDYDTQARFDYKRSTKWVGYKVHLTETCDEETPNIITNVQTESATFNDNYSLPKIHEQLSQAELLPDKHLVDAGYIEASNLVGNYSRGLTGSPHNHDFPPPSRGEMWMVERCGPSRYHKFNGESFCRTA